MKFRVGDKVRVKKKYAHISGGEIKPLVIREIWATEIWPYFASEIANPKSLVGAYKEEELEPLIEKKMYIFKREEKINEF